MTETRDSDMRPRTDEPDRADARTLGDVDHTHPDTNRTFGGNFTFARGGAVVADGGRPDVVPEDGDDDEPETLKDVEHTPPNDSDDANRVFERGGEAGEADGPDTAHAAEDGPDAARAAEDDTEDE